MPFPASKRDAGSSIVDRPSSIGARPCYCLGRPGGQAWRRSGSLPGKCSSRATATGVVRAISTRVRRRGSARADGRGRSIAAPTATCALDGLCLSVYANWPGAIHEGNGEALVLIDERADAAQRAALETLLDGKVRRPVGSAGLDVAEGARAIRGRVRSWPLTAVSTRAEVRRLRRGRMRSHHEPRDGRRITSRRRPARRHHSEAGATSARRRGSA